MSCFICFKFFSGHIEVAERMNIKFFCSARAMKMPGSVVLQRRPLSGMRVPFLRGLNFLLQGIEREAEVPGLHVDSYSKGRSTKMNGLFLNSGVHGMLEKRDYRAVQKVYPIIGAYIKQATGFRILRDYDWVSPHIFQYDVQSRVT